MLSKFSAILLVCLGALCAVNAHEHDQSATNTSSTDGSTPTANLTDLVAGLKALKFNTLANLLSNHTEKVRPLRGLRLGMRRRPLVLSLRSADFV